MKSGQITVFETFLAYKHKFNFFSSFVPFYCKRPISFMSVTILSSSAIFRQIETCWLYEDLVLSIFKSYFI